MKLELKVEQPNSSDEEDMDNSQSSSDIVLNRKVSWHNAHVVEFKVYYCVSFSRWTEQIYNLFVLCLSLFSSSTECLAKMILLLHFFNCAMQSLIEILCQVLVFVRLFYFVYTFLFYNGPALSNVINFVNWTGYLLIDIIKVFNGIYPAICP